MVVPTADGLDLLKEHAWYEYGKPEYISVMDFDYIYGKKDCLNSSSSTFNLSTILICFLVILPFVTYSLYSLTKLFIPHLRSKKLQPPLLSLKHSNKHSLPLSNQDCVPGLSFSNSTTPSSSPCMSSNQLNTYNIDENPYSYSSKTLYSH